METLFLGYSVPHIFAQVTSQSSDLPAPAEASDLSDILVKNGQELLFEIFVWVIFGSLTARSCLRARACPNAWSGPRAAGGQDETRCTAAC